MPAFILRVHQAQAEAAESLRGGTAQSGSALVICLVQKGGFSWLSVGDRRILPVSNYGRSFGSPLSDWGVCMREEIPAPDWDA